MAIKTFLSIRLGTDGAFLWIHVHLLFAHFQLVTHIVDAAGSFLDFSLG